METVPKNLNFNKLLIQLKSTKGQRNVDVENCKMNLNAEKSKKKIDAKRSKKKQSDPENKQSDPEKAEINLYNSRQFNALKLVNANLYTCPEDYLINFPVHSFVEELVKILKQPDIAKSEARLQDVAFSVLIKICKIFPSSSDSVVECDGVTVLVKAYVEVQDDKLAEQCLHWLEELSQVHPMVCLKARALMPVLHCRRSIVLKHVALSMALNICKKFTADTAEYGTSAVPFLKQYLKDPDTEVVEFSLICLNDIMKTLVSSPQRLDEVIKNNDFISQAATLISCGNSGGGQASLNTSAYRALVLLLSTCASSSRLGSELLLGNGITGILKDILTGSGIFPALSLPREQILEIVNLANDLLSPLVLPVIPERHDSIATEIITHEKLPEEWLKLLQQFEMDLLPVLMQICGSISNGPIPHKCLSVISKLMHFTRASKINSLLSVTNISRFLAGILARKDPQVLISALQIADTLMNKFPATFSKTFVKEGVLQAVNTIIISRPPDIAFPQPLSCAEDSFKHSGLAVGSPPILIKVPTSSPDMFVGVKSAAQALKVSYSKYNPQSIDVSSKELQFLKSLCFNLVTFDDQKIISEGSKAKEDLATPIISEILRTLIEGDYSTFEFIESGVVDAFLKYLSCGFHSNENISDSMLSNDVYHEQAARRCKSFITVSLPLGLQDKKMAPISILVKYLQSALSYLERFPVVLSHGGRSYNGYGHLSSGLSVLSRKCNLCLCRANEDESLIDYSSHVLVFNPLATLAAVEEFLWPRVQQDEFIHHSASAKTSETGTVPPSARMLLAQEKNDTSSKRKGKTVLTQKEESGTHMRIDARKGAVDKGAQMKIDEESNDDISDNEDQDDDQESNDDFSDNEDQDDVRGGFSTTREWRERLVVSPRLTFFAGGKQLSRNMSIYQVIQQFLLDEAVSDIDSDRIGLMSGIYTITYQSANRATNGVLVERTCSRYPCESRKVVSLGDSSKRQISLLNNILYRELPCDLEKSDPTYNILVLLYILEGLNKSSSKLHREVIANPFCEGKMSSLNDCTGTDGIVPDNIFINNRLTSKLVGQVEDALALRSKNLSSWCCQLTKACPFLFPFEMRCQYFYLTVFHFSRALYHRRQQKGVNGHDSENKEGVRVGRLRQRNVRVSRDSTLESVAQVMEMDNNQRKYVLEVYFGEVDIGLESTLEFYTFLVLELQKVGIEMWRLNNASVNSMMEVKEIGSKGNTAMAFDALIQTPRGLFPSSWPPNADLSDGSTFKKVVDYFKLLGRVLATALQDKRPLNLSFSSAFYKLLLGQDLSLHDINSFDPELGKNLLRYQALVDGKLFPGSRGGINEVIEIQFSENENVNEDPDHDFTLPGYPFHEHVYINNLKEYIDYVFDVTTGSGIERQLEALRAGFNEVFDISSLQIFSAKELEYMLCNKK
ncbi:E3 ubiquitin-protein ligase UPL3-like [Apium graveolens]|uniref:E3 ubiquitin-protein ligase UPL3-like n=1 Tax=Apium graveolens TaxID=4045 RepID=UPI003D7BBD94